MRGIGETRWISLSLLPFFLPLAVLFFLHDREERSPFLLLRESGLIFLHSDPCRWRPTLEFQSFDYFIYIRKGIIIAV